MSIIWSVYNLDSLLFELSGLSIFWTEYCLDCIQNLFYFLDCAYYLLDCVLFELSTIWTICNLSTEIEWGGGGEEEHTMSNKGRRCIYKRHKVR